MLQTEYITKPEQYFHLLSDTSNIIKNIQMINNNMIMVSRAQEEEFVDAIFNTNSIIAAYVTAQARLKLYSYIEQMDDRVLYFDTDSLVYLTRPGDVYNVPTGNYLGEMTDELAKDYGCDSYITEFVSGGPKNYGYIVNTGDSIVKIRGFRLTSQVSNILNFKLMKKFVHNFVKNNISDCIKLPYFKIVRTKEREILSKHEDKTYKIVYDKRVVLNNYFTVPFGYK